VQSVKLGYSPAERQAKLWLAYALNQVLDHRGLTQTAAGTLLGLSQPKVSALRNYKLVGFSVERLMTFLNALGQDVEVVIKSKPRSRQSARITVVAASRRDLKQISSTASVELRRHATSDCVRTISPRGRNGWCTS
jgi:predicted XRE-type DNA-binding protein